VKENEIHEAKFQQKVSQSIWLNESKLKEHTQRLLLLGDEYQRDKERKQIELLQKF